MGEIEARFSRGGVSDTGGRDDEKENKQQQLIHRRSPLKLGKLFVMEMSRDPFALANKLLCEDEKRF